MVPDLEDISREIFPLLTIRLSASPLASHMNRNETLPYVALSTMEFLLMSSEKVAVGLRTENGKARVQVD